MIPILIPPPALIPYLSDTTLVSCSHSFPFLRTQRQILMRSEECTTPPACPLSFPEIIVCVVHAQGVEDGVLNILVERLSRHYGDDVIQDAVRLIAVGVGIAQMLECGEIGEGFGNFARGLIAKDGQL